MINGMGYLLSSGSDTYQMCEYAGGYSVSTWLAVYFGLGIFLTEFG